MNRFIAFATVSATRMCRIKNDNDVQYKKMDVQITEYQLATEYDEDGQTVNIGHEKCKAKIREDRGTSNKIWTHWALQKSKWAGKYLCFGLMEPYDKDSWCVVRREIHQGAMKKQKGFLKPDCSHNMDKFQITPLVPCEMGDENCQLIREKKVCVPQECFEIASDPNDPITMDIWCGWMEGTWESKHCGGKGSSKCQKKPMKIKTDISGITTLTCPQNECMLVEKKNAKGNTSVKCQKWMKINWDGKADEFSLRNNWDFHHQFKLNTKQNDLDKETLKCVKEREAKTTVDACKDWNSVDQCGVKGARCLMGVCICPDGYSRPAYRCVKNQE